MSGELEVVFLKVDEIKKSNIAIRPPEVKDPQFQGLQASINEFGIENPLAVNVATNPETGETEYELIDGLQRLTAAGLLGIDQVPVRLHNDMSAVSRLALQYSMNEHRVKMKPAAAGQQFSRMIAELDMDINALAKMTGVSTDYISVRLNLAKKLCEQALPESHGWPSSG